jgi:uncharacterized protein (DUF1697 family)
MPSYIALLRGINVGGHNAVAMADLRKLATDLGFSDVATLLQSGNLVFNAGKRSGNALESLLERETAERVGVAVDYVVRSADEWKAVVAGNPFPQQAKDDPGHLVVVFLKTALPPKSVESLQAAIVGPEIVRGSGKQLYIVYPDGMGRSKLTGTLIEKKLDTRGTARNWNTVLKLLALSDRPHDGPRQRGEGRHGRD